MKTKVIFSLVFLVAFHFGLFAQEEHLTDHEKFEVKHDISRTINFQEYDEAHLVFNQSDESEVEAAGLNNENLIHFEQKISDILKAKGYAINDRSNLEVTFFVTYREFYNGVETVKLIGSDMISFTEAPEHVSENIHETDGTAILQAREKDTDKLVWFASTEIYFDKESKDFQEHSVERMEMVAEVLMKQFPEVK